MWLCLCFFFKQKTAYEMRISDWSSDVCSSDLAGRRRPDERADEEDDEPRLHQILRLAGGSRQPQRQDVLRPGEQGLRLQGVRRELRIGEGGDKLQVAGRHDERRPVRQLRARKL